MLDIMGFSGYPDPMDPGDNSLTSFQKTFNRLNTTISKMQPIVNRYGKYANGPFAGQWKKQAFVVEYATTFVSPRNDTDAANHARMFFNIIKPIDWFVGALWWEPTYCFNNWEHDSASLYHGTYSTGKSTALPVPELKVWGSFASGN